MTAVAIIVLYVSAVGLCVLAIRRAGRDTVRSDRFTRLVDEDPDER